MHPRRVLTTTSLAALTFFCVAGGPYGLEDSVGTAGPLLTILGLLIVPWIWSFPTALMTAELSSAMPEDGGYVIWVKRAFGRFWGFQEGWLSWVLSFFDNALYPVMFVDYLTYLRGDMSSTERWLIGVGVVSLMTWLNIRGVRLVGLSSVIFTLFVLAPFVTLVLWGLPTLKPSTWMGSVQNFDLPLFLSVMLWNSCGWDNAGCVAGEVKEPQTTYPRAMALGVLLVALSYLLPILVGVSADHQWDQWREGYFPKIGAAVGGPWLGTWITLAGLVSAVGLFNALLCASARVPYAMANMAVLPSALGKLHARHSTPWIALLLNSVGVVLLLPFSFQDLVQVDMFLYALALILEFAALIWLRMKAPEMSRPYRIPFDLKGVIFFSFPPVALCLFSMAIADSRTQFVSLGAIVLGLIVYGAMTSQKKSEPYPSPLK